MECKVEEKRQGLFPARYSDGRGKQRDQAFNLRLRQRDNKLRAFYGFRDLDRTDLLTVNPYVQIPTNRLRSKPLQRTCNRRSQFQVNLRLPCKN